mgnify:CR=1 FL=1
MKAEKNNLKKRPRVKQNMPDKCFSCGNHDGYVVTMHRGLVEFREESFEIEYNRYECEQCGHAILSDEQIDEQLKLLVRAYQIRHGLLTADDVKESRIELGLSSQEEFCRRIEGVISIATLKRIESGRHVQDKGTDHVMRNALLIFRAEEAARKTAILLNKSLLNLVEIDDYNESGSSSSLIAFSGSDRRQLSFDRVINYNEFTVNEEVFELC